MGECAFVHDDIEVLYGVPPVDAEDLPKTCTCGRPLTYSRHLLFVQQRPIETVPDVLEVTDLSLIKQ